MVRPESPQIYMSPVDRQFGIERHSFPDTHRQRLNSLLKCFNFGPKAVTYFCIPSEGAISITQLAEEYRSTFEGTQLEGLSKQNIRNYVMLFYLNGLVDISRVKARQGPPRVMIKLTEEGRKFGVLAAAATLEAEDAMDETMVRYLGNAGSVSESGLSTSTTRVLLLDILAQEDSVATAANLSRKLGIPLGLIQKPLRQLGIHGLATYNTSNTKLMQGQKEYKVNPESSLDVEKLISKGIQAPQLGRAVISACNTLQGMKLSINTDTVFNFLPKDIRDGWKNNNLRIEINRFLSLFTSKGALQHVTERGSKLTDKGHEFVSVLVKKYNAIASGNIGNNVSVDKVNEIRDNLKDYAVKASRRYFSYSHNERTKNQSTNVLSIANMLRGSVEQTIGELSEELGIHASSIHNYLDRLENGITIDTQKYRLSKVIRRGIGFYKLIPVNNW